MDNATQPLDTIVIKRQRYSSRILLLLVILAAFLLRAIQFSFNPPGLYFDEATAGYEAFSLQTTGADRWGFPFPVYFMNWGNGQNVLYSYLSIPFVGLFGLSRFSVRLVSLFVGILTLPLLYVTVKRRLGEPTALVATALLAILPWHIMVSRWALDSNILPFFVLLGILAISRALERDAPDQRVWVALIPWALGLYAYVLFCVPLPFMFAAMFLAFHRTILERRRAWMVSMALFAVVSLPMFLFLVKNLIVHGPLPFEQSLPFGIPLLLTSRMQNVTGPIPGRWIDSLFFILSGFQEGDYHDSLIGNSPIFILSLPLSLVGAAYWLREARRARRVELFLLWMLASVPVLLLVDANVHRFNIVILPLLVASAYGLVKVSDALRSRLTAKRFLWIGASTLLGVQTTFFVIDYFLILPDVPEYQSAYTSNYDRAIAKGLSMAPPQDPILLQENLEFSYIFVLFYTSYPAGKFQREVNYTLEYSEYWVRSFGRFHVGEGNLPDPQGSFSYILGKWNDDPCPDPERFWETRLWKVGRCVSRE